LCIRATRESGRRGRRPTGSTRGLARLLAAGSLDGLWMPDEQTRTLRRRLARRSQLVRARTRATNECHAALVRRLIKKPAVSDLFGLAGREWLRDVELPIEERETVDGCLRQIDFLDQEIAEVEQQVARDALVSPQIKRLMTVPGVNVIVAATFLAAVADISRFPPSRQLVGYLGLDPRVRQSGSTPATHGRISKQGSASARHALVEASWSVVRQPGPLHAFYQRIRVRRGHQVAVVAAARKLACLFWCMLTRGEDYAFQQPSLTRKKLRRSSSKPAPRAGRAAARSGASARRCAKPSARSPAKPNSPTSAPLPTGIQRRARARHRDAHLKAVKAASSAAGHRSQTLRFSSSPAPPRTLASSDQRVQRTVDFHPSRIARASTYAVGLLILL
jgi:transposase